jgi:hypothetical protein
MSPFQLPRERAAALRAEDLRTYLDRHGWQPDQAASSDLATLYRFPTERDAEILVPNKPDLVDYANRMSDAVVMLAAVEQRPFWEVLADLARSPCRCPVCGMDDASTGDDEHNENHRRFLEAGLALGYYPEPYEVREQRKKFGWDLVQRSRAEVLDQVYGALQVIQAWYDRSLTKAIENGSWRKHPTFERYVGMIGDATFPSEVLAILRRRFGHEPGQLDAQNCWRPMESQPLASHVQPLPDHRPV